MKKIIISLFSSILVLAIAACGNSIIPLELNKKDLPSDPSGSIEVTGLSLAGYSAIKTDQRNVFLANISLGLRELALNSFPKDMAGYEKNKVFLSPKFTSKYDFKSIQVTNFTFIWENPENTLGAATIFFEIADTVNGKTYRDVVVLRIPDSVGATAAIPAYTPSYDEPAKPTRIPSYNEPAKPTRIKFSSVYIASEQEPTHKKTGNNTFEVYVTSEHSSDIHQKGHSLDREIKDPEKIQALKDLFTFESSPNLPEIKFTSYKYDRLLEGLQVLDFAVTSEELPGTELGLYIIQRPEFSSAKLFIDPSSLKGEKKSFNVFTVNANAIQFEKVTSELTLEKFVFEPHTFKDYYSSKIKLTDPVYTESPKENPTYKKFEFAVENSGLPYQLVLPDTTLTFNVYLDGSLPVNIIATKLVAHAAGGQEEALTIPFEHNIFKGLPKDQTELTQFKNYYNTQYVSFSAEGNVSPIEVSKSNEAFIEESLTGGYTTSLILKEKGLGLPNAKALLHMPNPDVERSIAAITFEQASQISPVSGETNTFTITVGSIDTIKGLITDGSFDSKLKITKTSGSAPDPTGLAELVLFDKDETRYTIDESGTNYEVSIPIQATHFFLTPSNEDANKEERERDHRLVLRFTQ